MAIVAAETDITATSPSGTVVNPVSVALDGANWVYKFPTLSEVGDWQIKLAAAGFDKPVGTVLGKISVLQGTQVLFAVPWNEASNPAIATLQSDVATIKADLEGNTTADASAITAVDTKITALADQVKVLPTTETLAPVKTAIAKLQTDLDAIATDKASASSVAALDTAIGDVKRSVESLAALPVSATKAELDAAVADYEAKLKAANDAIAAANNSVADGDKAIGTQIEAISTAIEEAQTNIGTLAQQVLDRAFTGQVDDIDIAYKEADVAILERIEALIKRVGGDEAGIVANSTEIGKNAAAIQAIRTVLTDINAAIAKLTSFYQESVSPPNFDLPDWKLWHQIITEGTNRHSWLYSRAVGFNDAILIKETIYSMIANHEDAVETSPGNFSIELSDGTQLNYSTSRGDSLGQVVFTAGRFKEIEWCYLDSGGVVIRAGYKVETVAAEDVAKGLGRTTAPSNAASARVRLIRIDGTDLIFIHPLA